MLKISPILFSLIFLFSSGQKNNVDSIATPGIIPAPVKIQKHEGHIQWQKNIIIVSKENTRKTAALLQEFFSAKDIKATIKNNSSEKNKITLAITSDPSLGKEGYLLNANETGLTISANAEEGLFYGLQSFLQLVSADGKQFPFTEITDYPRFAYRGLHLDVSRHIFSPEFCQKVY